MQMEKLLESIKDVESKISILKNLRAGMAEKDETERCAGISYRGSWTVYFTQNEVNALLQQRWDGLHVQLGRLLEAKKAGEITMEGWLNQSRGNSNEQEGTE